MLTSKFKGSDIGWGETIGIVLGMITGMIVSVLIGAWIIHWILGAIGIGNFTYSQVVGLLAIWELIKPRVDSK